MSISYLSAIPDNEWRVHNLGMSPGIVWLPANRMEGDANADRAVVRKGGGHLEGRGENCKGFRVEGCEEESAGHLQ
jgi:hypothetical protein